MRIVEIAPTLNVGCTQCSQQAIQVLVDDIASGGIYVMAEIVEAQCSEHAKILRETA